MENQFANVMAERSDDQLRTILSQHDRYEPEAILAAVEELERRNLHSPDLLVAKEEAHKRVEQRKRDEESTTTYAGSGLALLKPTKEYFYTPIILYINVAIWILMIVTGVDPMSPSVDHLINWGGNLRSLTLAGEPWRLFTNIFLHGGAFHIAFNMYALVTIGVILEPRFGRHRYLLCYIATGILASITSIAFNPNIVSVGASGAIFGLDGLLLALLITKNIDIPQELRKNLLSSTVIFIGYNLVFGFAKEGIDNAAHIGGLVSGFIFGLLYYPTLRQPARSRIISAAILAIVVAAVLLAPKVIRNEFQEYQAAIETFARNEEKAMWMYKTELPDSIDVPKFQERLDVEGVQLWKENINVLSALTDMPQGMKQRIDLLITYCNLRLKSCEAISVLVEENTEANKEKVNAIEDQINSVIDQLQKLNSASE